MRLTIADLARIEDPLRRLEAWRDNFQVEKTIDHAIALLVIAREAAPARVASVTPLPFALPSADEQLQHARAEIERLTAVCEERDAALAKLIGQRDTALALLAHELPNTKDSREALYTARVCFGLPGEPEQEGA